MQLKTILNRVEWYKSFVYEEAKWREGEGPPAIEIPVQPRKNGRPICSGCRQPAPGYDQSPEPRRFEFVPLWGIAVFFVYRMRRVQCPTCGVKVEQVPWCDGKNQLTMTYRWFLAAWAKRLSWREVAVTFGTCWQSVFRSVRHAVFWGIAHVNWSGIKSIGIDEIQWQRGHRYLTLVYQIDEDNKRLLWIGKERTKATLEKFFRLLGDKSQDLEFVCSDMWQPYLDVIAQRADSAIHVLDRYHVMAKMNKAIDEVRAAEARQLKADGYEPILKHTRWCFLKRPEHLTDKQTVTISEVLKYNLRTVQAYLQKVEFQRFWEYKSAYWAGRFLDEWCHRAMRSRIEPMQKVARMLQSHRELLLNWFWAKGTISAGVVEGLNNKVKLTMRKSYGFRTKNAAEIALYHNLAKLPEPEFTHRFW
jgi:transposase